MGNARAAQERAGVKRKGPRARVEEYNAMRERLREGEAERQRKSRQLRKERLRDAQLLAVAEEEPEEGEEIMSLRDSLRVVSELVNFFLTQMERGVEILYCSIFWSKGVGDKKIGVSSSSYKFMIMVISRYIPCSSRMY